LAATADIAPARRSAGTRLADLLHGRRRTQVGLLLAGPLGWLVIAYLGSLAVLFVAAFWQLDDFSGQIVHSYSLTNFQTLWDGRVYREIVVRTVGTAAAVTLTDAVLAFPIAYYMARVAAPRTRNLLVIAVLMPLWANYLVKAYSWRTILSENGVINWALDPLGLSFDGYSSAGLWLVFTYLWLPFMILPIYAGLERIPSSLFEASADLGGRSFVTFRRVILPLAFPAVVAGSIFTFSLTLGDYIAPGLITNEQFVGTVIYNIRSQALPTAAAFSLVPIAVILGYLMVARKLKAFDSL
jgi:putative spermidine/putrescine transport system permease protein